jgi:hypothetical protein
MNEVSFKLKRCTTSVKSFSFTVGSELSRKVSVCFFARYDRSWPYLVFFPLPCSGRSGLMCSTSGVSFLFLAFAFAHLLPFFLLLPRPFLSCIGRTFAHDGFAPPPRLPLSSLLPSIPRSFNDYSPVRPSHHSFFLMLRRSPLLRCLTGSLCTLFPRYLGLPTHSLACPSPHPRSTYDLTRQLLRRRIGEPSSSRSRV